LVNLSVIAHFLRRRSERSVSAIFGWIIVPLAGAAVDLYLLMNLDGRAKLVGLAWLVLGVIWLAWLTRGFREEPPRISIEEEAEDTT
jgi:amino acid transporter